MSSKRVVSPKTMKSDSKQIIIAADHAGYALKEELKKFLAEKGFETLDVGAHELRPDDDYPEFMAAAAMKVAEDLSGETRAIILGGSGQGEAMVANRFPGVRAAVWYGGDLNIIRLSREHNNANILSIGARFVDKIMVRQAVELWLTTPFSGEARHERRIMEIDNIE